MDVNRRDWLTAGTALVLVLLPVLLFWSQLPEPMAIHWRLSGEPDDQLPKLAWLPLMFFLWGVVFATYLLVRERAPSTWKPPFTFGALGVLFWVQIVTMEANAGESSWRNAEAMTGPIAWTGLVVAWVVFGFAAYYVERH